MDVEQPGLLFEMLLIVIPLIPATIASHSITERTCRGISLILTKTNVVADQHLLEVENVAQDTNQMEQRRGAP